MKDDAVSGAGRAVGDMLNALGHTLSRREHRIDTILDAYIKSGKTGRSYQEERDELLRRRGLGTIND